MIGLLTDKVSLEVGRRFSQVVDNRRHAEESVDASRHYVEAMLGLEVWSHSVYSWMESGRDQVPEGGIHRHG